MEHGDDDWSPYQTNVLTSSPILPAFGLEQYGLPTPRKNAEAWRHFDVQGMVQTDYSGSPEGIGTDAVIDDDTALAYREVMEKQGAWIGDEDCAARLVYINGRYCPTMSKATDHARNLSPADFEDGGNARDEILDCLNRLPDGFTDQLAAEVPSGDSFLSSFEKLSAPDHHVGEPTSQFALNNQQGTACFAALNSVRAGAVAFVDTPAGRDAYIDDPQPVVLINANTADMGCDREGGVACHPRSLVIAREGSSSSFVQSYIDLDEDESVENSKPKLSNGYTQIYIEAGANVTHAYLEESGGMATSGVELAQTVGDGSVDAREVEAIRAALRNTHLEAIDVHVTGDNGRYTVATLGLGGNGRSRVALSASLLRPGSHANLNGFVLAAGAQRTETKTNIHHIAQGTTSQQTQRNMIGGRASSSFRGRIRVEQSAQQTDSDQLTRTILLSDKSRVWTVPSLEIIADDVQCTHGATVSDLSEEELFYLRSRGISRESARNMLMYAFVDEVGQAVPLVVRGKVDAENSLKLRCMKRLQNVVPQGDRQIRGEFQSS